MQDIIATLISMYNKAKSVSKRKFYSHSPNIYSNPRSGKEKSQIKKCKGRCLSLHNIIGLKVRSFSNFFVFDQVH